MLYYSENGSTKKDQLRFLSFKYWHDWVLEEKVNLWEKYVIKYWKRVFSSFELSSRKSDVREKKNLIQ